MYLQKHDYFTDQRESKVHQLRPPSPPTWLFEPLEFVQKRNIAPAPTQIVPKYEVYTHPVVCRVYLYLLSSLV